MAQRRMRARGGAESSEEGMLDGGDVVQDAGSAALERAIGDARLMIIPLVRLNTHMTIIRRPQPGHGGRRSGFHASTLAAADL